MLMTMHIVKGMLAFQKVPFGEGTVALPSSHTCDAAWMRGGPATVSTPAPCSCAWENPPRCSRCLGPTVLAEDPNRVLCPWQCPGSAPSCYGHVQGESADGRCLTFESLYL